MQQVPQLLQDIGLIIDEQDLEDELARAGVRER